MRAAQRRRLRRQLNMLNPRRLVHGAVRLFQWADTRVTLALSGRSTRSADEEAAAQFRGIVIMAALFVIMLGLHVYAHSEIKINLFSNLNR